MRILPVLRRVALISATVALGAGGLSSTLDRTQLSTPQDRTDETANVSERDLFNRAIYDIRGLFVGRVADVVYSPEDGEAALLIAGVGSLLGGGSKDIALNPKTLRRVVREHRSVLVSDTSREALQAATAVRFDAASATWVPEDANPEKIP
ncbi:MAG: PRC-barrel domain-containing protein [Telmatospirillum sp.]|nr:PRC-barrel domain-containing protein [Telmatospirillum sp.]